MKNERCVIYATGHRVPDQYPRCYAPVFDRVDQARAWLMKFLAGKDYHLDGETILVETDLPIKLYSRELVNILAAPPSNEDIRADALQLILRFKYGTWDEVHLKAVTPDETDAGGGNAIIAKRAPKADRPAKAQRPDGYVTITDLCAASGMPAMIARAALRASGRDKPAYGWAFAQNEIPAIKKLCGIG